MVLFGGGSGYEFVYGGYVGEGMLSVVVCGEVFMLLLIDVVFVVICVSVGLNGVLLIVKNYIGDWFNFGFVVEFVCVEGILVEIVIVVDDVLLCGCVECS